MILMYNHVFAAEFQGSIHPAIPKIVSFLNDGHWDVCIAGADVLSKLSEQGKVEIF